MCLSIEKIKATVLYLRLLVPLVLVDVQSLRCLRPSPERHPRQQRQAARLFPVAALLLPFLLSSIFVHPSVCPLSMDIHSPSRDHPGKVPDRPSKRRKIAVACDQCRTRKIRCDGIQPGISTLPGIRSVLTNSSLVPVCGPCTKRSNQGDQCVYTGEPEKKRAVRK